MQWQRRVELGIAQQRNGDVMSSAAWLGNGVATSCGVRLRTAMAKLSPVGQRYGEVSHSIAMAAWRAA